MSYSTLILSLLFLVLSSIPPSFCVNNDGCYYDQRPCTQESLFPNAESPRDCARNLGKSHRNCLLCNFGCPENCRSCLKKSIYDTTTSCCPEGYCIPFGVECSEDQSKVINCCDDNGIIVTCDSTRVCCNNIGANCSTDDACCGILNCGYNATTGGNVCQICYQSMDICTTNDDILCCDPEDHCVGGLCRHCSLTGQDCSISSGCCYANDICVSGQCCKEPPESECNICAGHLEVCNDIRTGYKIPCCYNMYCSDSGVCLPSD